MSARILIVDDEPIVRNLLRDTLTGRGYDLAFAGNGVEALEKLEAEPFDLLLSDVVMPEMEGFELLKRAKKVFPDLRVIILTGFSREHDISDFLLYGADEYLTKPFQVQELLAAVEQVLGA
jgi:two-component system cell cycle response regulator CpdR